METAPKVYLSSEETALYNKFIEKNPGITMEDFTELRGYALKSRNPGAKNFFSVNGVIMESKGNLDTDEAKELKDLN